MYLTPTDQESHRRGVAVLALHFILVNWWHNLRANNVCLSTVFPPRSNTLSHTRPQRMACWCLQILANMAVSALFFGSDPGNAAQVEIPVQC